MKIDITTGQQALLRSAIEQAIASAKRAQNAKRSTPQLSAVYEQTEKDYNALLLTINTAK